MTDSAALIKKINSGDTRAFQSLIEDFQRLVYHIVFRMVANAADRQDVCQDIFVKVYQNLSQFQHESKLSTWIAKIAYNTAINHLKKKKVPLFDDRAVEGESIETQMSGYAGPDDFAEERDLSDRLKKEIEQLPMQFRTILTLYHLEEMSYSEIAEILKLPAGTVKSYLFRARKLLKERLVSKYQLEEACH